MSKIHDDLHRKLNMHLSFIYPQLETNSLLCEELIQAMGIDEHCIPPEIHQNHWDETDIFMISYADSILSDQFSSLQSLKQFSLDYLTQIITTIHLLPFYPYSSDDGFSVIDYYEVNQSFGDWDDINNLSQHFSLMGDLVINHCSSRSGWFENYKKRKHPGKDYFYEASPSDELSDVVRPRTSPLLKEVETVEGKRHVWCTFSHDQIDLDFSNPKVLIEFVNILHFYIQNNIRIFRLDAVAFLWKELGTSCINLPQTHHLIQLLRLLVEHKKPDAIIITETNVPNKQNLSYFGNANEAHAIYNFSLPPLLLNTLLTGNSLHLKNWLMSLPPAQNGTCYYNFIASHDGIGLRPIEGILNEKETEQLITTLSDFGAKVSWRILPSGENKAYEINISLFDALKGTNTGIDSLQQQRYLCAHAIMLAIEGIPAFYIHSLFATQNDNERVEASSQNRSINRHKWNDKKLQQHLEDESSHHSQIFKKLTNLIQIRKQQAAFHPNATQYTLHLTDQLFAFWRQSADRKQSIFAINNISNKPQSFDLTQLNLIELDQWYDLISKKVFDDTFQTIELSAYQTLWISNK